MFSGIVAKISLSISVFTFAILMVMISIALVDHGGSYNDFIQSQLISHKNIQYSIIIAGLLLIFLSALISWSVTLYGSFRIAGPLYRFVQNISHCHGSDTMLSLRSDDCLQDLSAKIIHAAKQIENHKHEILTQINSYQQLLALADAPDKNKKIVAILQHIKQIESRVKLDE